MNKDLWLIDYYRRRRVVHLFPDGRFALCRFQGNPSPCGFAWRFRPLPWLAASLAAIYVSDGHAMLLLDRNEYAIGGRTRVEILVTHRPFLGKVSLVLNGGVVKAVSYLRIFESTFGAIDFTRDQIDEEEDDFFLWLAGQVKRKEWSDAFVVDWLGKLQGV